MKGSLMSYRDRPEYLPTRRQIVSACAAIRRQWTPAERRRRSAGGRMAVVTESWSPPCIQTAHCMARVRKMVAEAAS
jgi:hypothetical protein